jgi:DNA-binding CsgD family transcriptional regulator
LVHSQIAVASTPAIDWSLVAADCGAAVMLISQDLHLLTVNPVAAQVYAKRPAKDASTSRLSDIFPGLAAQERTELVRTVLATGEPVIFRDLWSGVALRATLRRVDGPSGAPAVLWLACAEDALHVEAGTGPHVRVQEAKHVDLGPLTGLTMSELKVLALIGEGLSNAEIAARLHRAVKTVESHRAALTDKTGSSSRVQLGIMARRAGLARRLVLDVPGGDVRVLT